jgi:hypothetical protein
MFNANRIKDWIIIIVLWVISINIYTLDELALQEEHLSWFAIVFKYFGSLNSHM